MVKKIIKLNKNRINDIIICNYKKKMYIFKLTIN